MPKSDLMKTTWEWVQRIIYISVIGLASFCWKMNREINTITDNAEDIKVLRTEHNEDKNKLWEKYSDLVGDIKANKSECVSHVKDIQHNTTSIKFLEKNHD